ncbi:MAG TPA: DUF3105 domain-containing protein [Nocardioidaceae bacterium]|nr:DUF3105 domain-containing protein [Nocardioidaceae bacterium]
MGKSSKTNERRARIEQLERERKAAERKRLFLFSGVIGLVALVIIGVTGWALWSDRQEEQAVAATDLAEFGVAESAAGCDPVQEEPASGGADHIEPPQPIQYDQAPPASGPHRPTWAAFERKFYTAEDRPEVEMLVHNLEHGYNILWYDETIANNEQQVAEIENLASKFEGSERDPGNAFIAAPWTAEDGGEFPQGKHIALTHWYADPDGGGDEASITRYCEQLSGAVVEDFMQEWEQSEAREGGAGFL